jgi:hypothetical protein
MKGRVRRGRPEHTSWRRKEAGAQVGDQSPHEKDPSSPTLLRFALLEMRQGGATAQRTAADGAEEDVRVSGTHR